MTPKSTAAGPSARTTAVHATDALDHAKDVTKSLQLALMTATSLEALVLLELIERAVRLELAMAQFKAAVQ